MVTNDPARQAERLDLWHERTSGNVARHQKETAWEVDHRRPDYPIGSESGLVRVGDGPRSNETDANPIILGTIAATSHYHQQRYGDATV